MASSTSTAPPTTSTIYIKLSNKYNHQPNPISIHPPLTCTFTRYSRHVPTDGQPAIELDFSAVVNQRGLGYSVQLTLSQLPKYGPRYGLRVKVIDNHGYTFVNNRPIMLNATGGEGLNPLPKEKTFYLILDHNMTVPIGPGNGHPIYGAPNVATN